MGLYFRCSNVSLVGLWLHLFLVLDVLEATVAGDQDEEEDESDEAGDESGRLDDDRVAQVPEERRGWVSDQCTLWNYVNKIVYSSFC